MTYVFYFVDDVDLTEDLNPKLLITNHSSQNISE